MSTLIFSDPGTVVSLIEGKIRALGVSTIDAFSYCRMCRPLLKPVSRLRLHLVAHDDRAKGTPDAIVDKLREEFEAIIATPGREANAAERRAGRVRQRAWSLLNAQFVDERLNAGPRSSSRPDWRVHGNVTQLS